MSSRLVEETERDTAKSLMLASLQGGLAFQRTRLAEDRTMMAIIRTSLSLISFGFTIVQFFRAIHHAGFDVHAPILAPAHYFGTSLVVLGMGILILGIVRHVRFTREILAERAEFVEQGLLRGKLSFPISISLITATILLLIGIVATIAIIEQMTNSAQRPVSTGMTDENSKR